MTRHDWNYGPFYGSVITLERLLWRWPFGKSLTSLNNRRWSKALLDRAVDSKYAHISDDETDELRSQVQELIAEGERLKRSLSEDPR